MKPLNRESAESAPFWADSADSGDAILMEPIPVHSIVLLVNKLCATCTSLILTKLHPIFGYDAGNQPPAPDPSRLGEVLWYSTEYTNLQMWKTSLLERALPRDMVRTQYLVNT